MLLGIFIYIIVIPILDSLSTLVCQWLENLKGELIYKQTIIQHKIDEIGKQQGTSTHAIGFSISDEDEDIEEEEDE